LLNLIELVANVAPDSLADDIWKEARDPDINPEILRDAEVRVSGDLCDDLDSSW
jgi:phospholipase A2